MTHLLPLNGNVDEIAQNAEAVVLTFLWMKLDAIHPVPPHNRRKINAISRCRDDVAGHGRCGMIRMDEVNIGVGAEPARQRRRRLHVEPGPADMWNLERTPRSEERRVGKECGSGAA